MPTHTQAKSDVFVSYAHEDSAFVERLLFDLSRLSIGLWFDRNEVVAGDHLLERVRDGIAGARNILFVTTKNSVNSKWVVQEAHLAVEARRTRPDFRIITAVIDADAAPPVLDEYLHLDFSDYRRALDRLLDALYPGKSLERAVRAVLEDERVKRFLPHYVQLTAVDAAHAHLIPTRRVNLASVIWGCIELFLCDNERTGVTRLTVAEQWEFTSALALRLYSEGGLSILRRFFSAEMNGAFDWRQLSGYDEQIRDRAVFCDGPPRGSFGFTHQLTLDFFAALDTSSRLGALRPEYVERWPRSQDTRATVRSQGAVLPESVARLVIALSGNQLSKILEELLCHPQESSPIGTAGAASILRLTRARKWVDDLSGRDLRSADLRSLDLSSISLARCDLQRALMTGVDLSGADLSDANVGEVVGLPPAVIEDVDVRAEDVVVVGTSDGAVWRVRDRSEHLPRAAHRAAVSAVKLSHGGRELLSAGYDGDVVATSIGRFERQRLIFSWRLATWERASFWHLVPDGLAQTADELRADYLHHIRKKWPASLTCLDLSPDGSSIALGTRRGFVLVVDRRTAAVQVLSSPAEDSHGRAHYDSVWSVRFSPHGDELATAGAAGEPVVKLWNLRTRSLYHVLVPTPAGDLRDVAFRDADNIVVCAETALSRWRVHRPTPEEQVDPRFRRLRRHESKGPQKPEAASSIDIDSEMVAMAHSPSWELVITGSKTGELRVWAPDSLKPLQTVAAHRGWISSIAFYDNGRSVVSVGWDGELRWWTVNADTLEPADRLRLRHEWPGLRLDRLQGADQDTLAALHDAASTAHP